MLRYDWGGISDFDNPNGIDEFKLKFGGDKITYYNVFCGEYTAGKACSYSNEKDEKSELIWKIRKSVLC